MALIATVGAPDANSYATVAEASAYFVNRVHATAWDSVDDEASALISASQLLDWYVKWKGVKTSSTQSMKWPRTGCYRPDGDGTLIDADVLPPELKVAVFELALSSLDSDRTADDPLAGIDEIKAGSIMIKAGNRGLDSSSRDAIPEKVWRIISDLYSSGSLSVVRLMRG